MQKKLIISNILTALVAVFFIFYSIIQSKYAEEYVRIATDSQTENQLLKEVAEQARIEAQFNEMEAIKQKMMADSLAVVANQQVVVANQQREIAESNRLLAEKLRSELARYKQSK